MAALTTMAVVVLAGCASGGGDADAPAGDAEGDASPGETAAEATGTDPESFTVLSPAENEPLRTQLDALAEGACADQDAALPLEHETIAQSDVIQRVTLLASQGALPAHFVAGTDQVRPEGDLGASDLVLDYESYLTDLGVWDRVLPAAASTVQNVYGQMVSLPYQYNFEGIWFNREVFEELGVEEPQTWDELLEVASAASEAGYIPMSQGGAQSWPLTRIIGAHIFRNVGPDAMAAVRDGEASLTDPEYVAGAQAFVDAVEAGMFGEGAISREYDASSADLLSGRAAMKYDGTWFLGSINDPEQNQVGAENIGFMPFPAVEGGAGSIDQYPANAGAAFATNPELAGPAVGDWLSCIAENYGQQALESAGILSGFQVDDEDVDIPELTADVQQRMAETDETVLWFEALLDSESNSVAQTNVSLLTNGQMTAEEYMADLQDSIDSNR